MIFHIPVLQDEVLSALALSEKSGERLIVDCTLGEGGHSELILQKFGWAEVIAFERDSNILQSSKERLAHYVGRVRMINDNFSNMSLYVEDLKGKIAAFLFDFGISSFHLDSDERGFTFREEQFLDMRLDKSCGFSAYDIVNGFSEKDMADIFYRYGEERHSRKIARMICRRREESPITTTEELASIVLKSVPRTHDSAIHPATRIFQALRIFVNDELSHIEKALVECLTFLAKGGIIAAISFHSLEDRIVKNVFRNFAKGCYCGGSKLCNCDRIPRIVMHNKKPIMASEDEVLSNPRARSAKLRVCEKL